MNMSFSATNTTLFYAIDPMCSWCWAFSPTWQALVEKLKGKVPIKYLMGGLASDNDEPMPYEMQEKLQNVWRNIQKKVPGTEFNFDYWYDCHPRRSTYPACRAVIAARNQGLDAEPAMILAIQQAYYIQARNPSDTSTLIDLAAALNFDMAQFESDLNAEKTDQTLMTEIKQNKAFGVQAFPSLVLQKGDESKILTLKFGDADAIFLQQHED